jgi:hypothetical protein
VTAAHLQESVLTPWLRRLTVVTLALYITLSAYVLWRAAVLTPYSDEIDWIQRWRTLQVDGDWSAYLLAPVNLHRLPWMFGLIAFDIQALGGTNLPLIVSGGLSVGAMTWLLGREAAKAATPPLAPLAATLAAMLALMAGSIFDAATPICVNYTHGAFFAVAAMVLADGGSRRGLGRRRAVALLVAMIAGLGDAAALAVWPVLVLGAVRRRDWAWLGSVLVAGGVFVGLYALGQGGDTRNSTQGALHHPAGALRLSLNYLTLPWSRLNLSLAWVGGLLIALIGLAAFLTRGGRQASRAERIACSFILFSLGTAAMAGLGRFGQPDPLNVPLRYAVLLAPLHVGLLMLALPAAGVLWNAKRHLATALGAASLLLMAAQNGLMAVKVVHSSDVVRNTLQDFRQGRRTPEMRVFVHPDLDHAERIYAGVRQDRLFQQELHVKRAGPAP